MCVISVCVCVCVCYCPKLNWSVLDVCYVTTMRYFVLPFSFHAFEIHLIHHWVQTASIYQHTHIDKHIQWVVSLGLFAFLSCPKSFIDSRFQFVRRPFTTCWKGANCWLASVSRFLLELSKHAYAALSIRGIYPHMLPKHMLLIRTIYMLAIEICTNRYLKRILYDVMLKGE